MYLYSVQLLDETSQSLQQFINLFIYDYLCIYLTVFFLLVYRIFSQSFAVFLHYFSFLIFVDDFFFLTHSTQTHTQSLTQQVFILFSYLHIKHIYMKFCTFHFFA